MGVLYKSIIPSLENTVYRLSSKNFKCPGNIKRDRQHRLLHYFQWCYVVSLRYQGTAVLIPNTGVGKGGAGILNGLTDSSFRVYWPAWSSGWRFARQVFSISPLHDLQKLARPNKLVRHVTQATGLYDSQNMGLALCQRTAPRQDVSHSFLGPYHTTCTTPRPPNLYGSSESHYNYYHYHHHYCK